MKAEGEADAPEPEVFEVSIGGFEEGSTTVRLEGEELIYEGMAERNRQWIGPPTKPSPEAWEQFRCGAR